jgi:hypothetical protein
VPRSRRYESEVTSICLLHDETAVWLLAPSILLLESAGQSRVFWLVLLLVLLLVWPLVEAVELRLIPTVLRLAPPVLAYLPLLSPLLRRALHRLRILPRLGVGPQLSPIAFFYARESEL